METESGETEVETCAQLFMRLTSKPSLESLDQQLFPSNFPKPGEVVEIHGASSTGKTELLMHFISRCILPKHWNGIAINGIEAEVLFIDTDLKFSVIRLHQILKEQLAAIIDKSYVSSRSCVIPEESMSSETKSLPGDIDLNERGEVQVLEELVKSCLDRLYLVRCSSTEQLLITLHSVEAVFSQHPQMSLFILDSLNAFYWEDRVQTGDNWKRFGALQDKVSSLLQKLIKDYRLVLFLTKMTQNITKDGKASYSSSNTNQGQNENFSSKSWSQLSTHRMILTRDDFPFPVVVKRIEKYASYWVKVWNKKEQSQHQCTFYISSNGISYP